MTVLDGIFVCPLCRAPLRAEGGSLFCGDGGRHCYDISASGYVNLLPPGRANNAKAGDDREMLKARSRFLDTGLYAKISEELASAAMECMKCGESVTFVDAGCGEGYHTLSIEKLFHSQNRKVCAVGLDASKYGVRLAAKRASGASGSGAVFAAANIFDMPLPDKCADAVFSLFAPIPAAEAARVLKDDGVLAVCSSGTYHLWEMRQVLYGEPRKSPPLSRVPDGFVPVLHTGSSYMICVEGRAAVQSLFEMTPFFCHCPADGRRRLEKLETLSVRVETVYNIYKKANNGK